MSRKFKKRGKKSPTKRRRNYKTKKYSITPHSIGGRYKFYYRFNEKEKDNGSKEHNSEM